MRSAGFNVRREAFTKRDKIIITPRPGYFAACYRTGCELERSNPKLLYRCATVKRVFVSNEMTMRKRYSKQTAARRLDFLRSRKIYKRKSPNPPEQRAVLKYHARVLSGYKIIIVYPRAKCFDIGLSSVGFP